MHCPNCGKPDLAQEEPAPGLVSLKCDGCGGRWIPSERYFAWVQKNGQNLPEREVSDTAFRPVPAKKARICPECGCIMTCHEVGHGVPFAIDRCAACGGFWLDRGEFEVLKLRNLHDDIHFVFGETWQRDILHRKETDAYERRVQAAIGRTDYDEARRIKSWIASHPHRAAIIAYLTGK